MSIHSHLTIPPLFINEYKNRMTRMKLKGQYKTLLLLLGLLAGVMIMPASAQDAPPPVVRLEVNPPTAKVGDTVTVAVRLENVTELYGLQVICQVDPAVLAGLTRVEGDAFTSANGFYVDQGMKPDGKWLIAATRLQPNPAFSGNGTAFTFQYTLQSAVNATLNCTVLGVDNKSMPLPITLVNGAPMVNVTVEPTAAIPTAVLPTEVIPTTEAPTATESVPTEIVPTEAPTEIQPTEVVPTVEATLAVGSNATIQGVIVNQFAPDSSGLSVQLTANGSLTQQTVTDAAGAFSFADIAPGNYVLLVSAPEHLALVYNVAVTGDGAAVDLGTQTFVTGDTDGNQTIDLADAVLISANFDSAVPPAPEGADLNHDGQVNVSDLVLIGVNFGLTGPIQVK